MIKRNVKSRFKLTINNLFSKRLRLLAVTNNFKWKHGLDKQYFVSSTSATVISWVCSLWWSGCCYVHTKLWYCDQLNNIRNLIRIIITRTCLYLCQAIPPDTLPSILEALHPGIHHHGSIWSSPYNQPRRSTRGSPRPTRQLPIITVTAPRPQPAHGRRIDTLKHGTLITSWVGGRSRSIELATSSGEPPGSPINCFPPKAASSRSTTLRSIPSIGLGTR